MVLHEKRAAPGSRFLQTGAARGDELLSLRIAVKNGDLDGLSTALLDAATPGQPTFRQWLSKEQVESYARPSAESLRAVTGWLSDHSLVSTSITPSGDWMSISVPVSTANRMLNATFAPFVHSETGARIVRTLEYSLPEAVSSHIRLIHPTTSFAFAPRPRKQIVTSEGALAPRVVADEPCETVAKPACLQQLYNLPIRVSSPTSARRIAIPAYQNQFASQSDLNIFLTRLRPDMPPNTTFSLMSLDGGINSDDPADAGLEANLDIQYALAVGGGLPTTFIAVGADVQEGGDPVGFLDTTFSSSYSFNHEEDIPHALSFAMCDAYQQLTARGVSILFASGDGGVSGGQPTECTGEKFIAATPACPWVTLVGATGSANPEIAANLSSGGFSYIFDAPTYQTAAVSGYLTQLQDQYSGLFNPSGRAYPDVAAQGALVAITKNGTFVGTAGTSASSPMFAGIVALLNDELISAGKPVLGFLNPWLYANPQMFNDIVSGSNPGCGTDGFPALPGWDPVTGLGTANYPLMRAAAGLSHNSLVSTSLQALLSALT
ncbi:subtilisin-like protein [Auricularia subglabra TFB-10046 SS5]|nr:subtilisin-like protein [Auricularia subglabra TFB-10046 SS5]